MLCDAVQTAELEARLAESVADRQQLQQRFAAFEKEVRACLSSLLSDMLGAAVAVTPLLACLRPAGIAMSAKTRLLTLLPASRCPSSLQLVAAQAAAAAAQDQLEAQAGGDASASALHRAQAAIAKAWPPSVFVAPPRFVSPAARSASVPPAWLSMSAWRSTLPTVPATLAQASRHNTPSVAAAPAGHRGGGGGAQRVRGGGGAPGGGGGGHRGGQRQRGRGQRGGGCGAGAAAQPAAGQGGGAAGPAGGAEPADDAHGAGAAPRRCRALT
jgi:hypothetical protein